MPFKKWKENRKKRRANKENKWSLTKDDKTGKSPASHGAPPIWKQNFLQKFGPNRKK